jgi:hypothetical protein
VSTCAGEAHEGHVTLAGRSFFCKKAPKRSYLLPLTPSLPLCPRRRANWATLCDADDWCRSRWRRARAGAGRGAEGARG